MAGWIKKKLLRLIGIYDYDRVGEERILKAIRLYHSGNRINRLRAWRLYNKNLGRYQINIRPDIEVGKDFHLVHAAPLRVGFGVSFGDNCKLYPFCHVMSSIKPEDWDNNIGTFKKATFGNDCILGAGCAVIGNLTIGDDVTIGAHAIVTKDVPSHSTVVGTNKIMPKREDQIPEKYKQNNTNAGVTDEGQNQ